MELPKRGASKKAAFSPTTVSDLYQDGLKTIRGEAQDYWLNHAFLTGHQWLYTEPNSRELRELPRDPDRYQATINRLAHSTRSIISKYMQRELTFEVMPDAATDKATTGASVSEAILEGLRRAHDWETKRELLGRAAWKGGTAALCVDWDPNAGDTLFDSGMDSDPEKPEEEKKALNEGDSKETVLTLAEFVVEPGVRDAETARWWIKAQALPPEEVQGTYEMSKKPPADATAGLTPFTQKLMTLQTSSNTSEAMADLTMVLTYYERPNGQSDKGRVAVVVDGQFVDGPKPWPFPWTDRLNFAIHRETPDENKWTGSTILSEARTVQVALNAAWSSILEHMKLAGNARLIVPHMAADLIDQFTDLPGEMMPWPDGVPPPAWLTPAPMPDWVLRQPGELAQEMDDILGVHDVSRGAAPVNIESGYGLSILAEQDNSPVGRLVKDSATCWSKVATMVLKLYEENTASKRATTISRDRDGPKSVQWTGNTLAGQTDVTIPLDGILPRSRAAMAAMAEKMAQMGLITSVEVFAKVAELPGQKSLLAATNPDTSRARRENYHMAQAQIAIPQPWDDHKIHILEHHNDMKNSDWDRLSPDVKNLYITHLQAHETLAAEAAGNAQRQAGVSPMLSAAPSADGTPSIDPSALPEGALAGVPGQPGDDLAGMGAEPGHLEDPAGLGFTPEQIAAAEAGAGPPPTPL